MPRRTPIVAPLPCYGLEYVPGSHLCVDCKFQTGCRALIKNPDAITLDRVSFQLTPDSEHIQRSMNVAHTTPAVYARAFRKVFGLQAVPDKPNPEVCTAIERKAAARGCSVETYCIIPMITRQATGDKFYAKMLTGTYADTAIEAYFAALIEDHRRIDLEVIQSLTGVNVHDRDFVTRFLRAEILFGTAVIDSFEKGFQSKKTILREVFPRADAIWQAVYPADFELKGSAARFRIAFRKKSSVAAQAFLAWEAAMPVAVERVLGARGFAPKDFKSREHVYQDTFQFWAACGYVFQHLRAQSLIINGSINSHG